VDLPHHEMGHGGDPTRRLALLSRFPITARNSQAELRYHIGDVILPMQRGILDATVALRPNFEVRFLGVHFKSQRDVPGMDQKLMRRNEAHLLRRHIESILGTQPATRLLAYGDFNESRHEAAIVEIEGVPGTDFSMMDIRLRDSRGESWTHFWDAADHYSRLDYCFVNRALQSHVKKPESFIFDPPNFYDGSDHRPLVIKIDRGAVPSRKKSKPAAPDPESKAVPTAE
jgi:endonuclease/exonuclease/phosphatase family metal-dependent hydrolase